MIASRGTFTDRWCALGLARRSTACSSPNPELYTIAPVNGATHTGGPAGDRAAADRARALPGALADRPLVGELPAGRACPTTGGASRSAAMLSRVLVEELSQRLPHSAVSARTARCPRRRMPPSR